MALREELERIAASASAHGEVTGVLAAEPEGGRRHYLVALGDGDARSWLVLDGKAAPVEERETVREVASVVVMCELACDLAAGGDVEELRSSLAQLRITERPPGIEEAEEAALELERTLGSPPRLATPAFLDAVGAAARRLEQALGRYESPFATALRTASGAVEGFVAEVETRYARPLR